MIKFKYIWGNIMVLLMFILIGVVFLVKARAFPEPVGAELGPAVFPSLISWGMIILSSILLVKNIYQLISMKTKDDLSEVILKEGKRLLIVIPIIFLYILLISRLGFIVSTLLLLIILFNMLDLRKGATSIKTRMINVLIACLSTIVIYLLFVNIFSITFPQGILF